METSLKIGMAVKLIKPYKGLSIGEVGEVEEIQGDEILVVFDFGTARKLRLVMEESYLRVSMPDK